MKTDKGALSLILYPYQFDSITDEGWTDSDLAKLKRIFPLDKLIFIDAQIKNYFDKKDIDLNNVLPSFDKTVSEKEKILSDIEQGIKILLEKNTH